MSQTNQQRLIDIMDTCDLDIASIGSLTSSSPHTVSAWLRPVSSKAHRNMPDRTLELLELKLAK